jgi:hypothetical protein
MNDMKTMLVGAVAVLALVGCGGGTGNVTFTAWGEELIEDKLPIKEGDNPGFVDGWSLKYTKFLVALGGITVAKTTGGSPQTVSGQKVFDLTKKGPVDVATLEKLPAERWDAVSYVISPASGATAGTASEADVTLVNTQKYSLYVEGTATKAAVTKSLKWGFATNTLYENCEAADTGKGVVVPNGATETVQLTIHGDHPFYDDLQSPEAAVRFDAIAGADANNDGEVTLAELEAVALTTLPVNQYGTGGASNVKNLKEFVTNLTRTVGHYRGEGECTQKLQ